MQLERGAVRPLLKTINSQRYKPGVSFLNYFDTALTLLLYSDEAAVEDPIHHLDSGATEDVLRALLAAQPLAESGAIRFFRYPPRINHPSRGHGFTNMEALRELPNSEEVVELMNEISNRNRDDGALSLQIFHARSSLGVSLGLSESNPGTFNMVVESAAEAALLPIGLYTAGRAATDIGGLNLSKLAALTVPQINPRGVWAVRRSSEEFAEWRAALGSALGDIEGIGADDERWHAEATDIIASALRPVQTRLNKIIASSPALEALRIGVTDLSYSAVGAATGALAGGSLVSGLTGAAGGKGAEVVVSYLRNLRKRREGKAVLDLVMSFYHNDLR